MQTIVIQFTVKLSSRGIQINSAYMKTTFTFCNAIRTSIEKILYHAPMAPHVHFGTSFSPEYAAPIGKREDVQAFHLFETIHETLGIKNIRFGLRWNRIDDGKKIDLGYYRKYLDYLFAHSCTVTLNIGPIKVFRWPEEHFPPHMGIYKTDFVTQDCELAKHAYEYLAKLLELLEKEYGDHLRDVTFQLENEPFYRFGRIGMLMSQEYVKELSRIMQEHRPGVRLLFDSAGRRDLRTLVNLFKSLIADYGYAGSDLVLGFNYYFRIGGKSRIFRRRDPFVFASPFDMNMASLHREQRRMGFGLEISEGQFEPWGSEKSPGNSIEEFDYLVKKSVRFFPRGYEYKLIRLWGTEQLAMKLASGSANAVHLELAQRIMKAA